MLRIIIGQSLVVYFRYRECSEFGTVTRALPSPRFIFVELINLLKGQPLSLINHGVYEHECDPAEAAPDPEYIGLGWAECSCEVWSDKRKEPIEEPVRSSGHRKTFSTRLKRENFPRDNPSARAKCGCFSDVSKDTLDHYSVHFTEKRDVYANKSELGAL